MAKHLPALRQLAGGVPILPYFYMATEGAFGVPAALFEYAALRQGLAAEHGAGTGGASRPAPACSYAEFCSEAPELTSFLLWPGSSAFMEFLPLEEGSAPAGGAEALLRWVGAERPSGLGSRHAPPHAPLPMVPSPPEALRPAFWPLPWCSMRLARSRSMLQASNGSCPAGCTSWRWAAATSW